LLNLARAIASPSLKLLLADEPVEGLSPIFVSKILEAFSKLVEEGVTMVIVETMPVIMKKLSGRCAILNAGTIVFEGSTEDLLKNEIIMKTYFGLA
jgi:branched-chain amino acid transport system ATP-binding protein